ncbi:cache domain-containing protein [Alisedimentitalea sp. MJ-SS2]|uniref:sensor histidine kinase n=1 Tax=Aliisedimentitalea sp. MJ-SS2 TaxID=3049795 RepID=UPI00290AE71E|nr:cache domain-containing protein [Alisedimentitalea sp. MJ-SS2]MDU8929367.1 cache domain-containing protein [Alisedimentitalea sp. MJ-SS2]
MALLPLVVLMPLVLFLGIARWSSEYDKILIANVESDLKVAEQYLGRILSVTGANVQSVAKSTEFQQALLQSETTQLSYLADASKELELDFLYYLPHATARESAIKWPVVNAAVDGQSTVEIDIFSGPDLAPFPGDLDHRARIELIETKAAVPTERSVEDRGMVVHTASPVGVPGHEGVLIGGVLLNRNLDFIDTINALVYLNATTGGERQGTATLFLEDVRVSTNVRLFEDVRALGTRVSAVVRGAVLDEGKTWLDRAFVVNDWYISGYLPITDSFGARVGMLYVGFLEAPFTATKRIAFLTIIGMFGLVLALTAPIFLRMAKGIFSPLEKMTRTMKLVEQGDLDARNGEIRSADEIGQVATHLDTLLDQVQERDQALRSWADELNTRVEKRTKELREANAKLEDTYQQLVMSEKLASIGEITAGVAHEINNPVAVIQGNVDVIRQTLSGNTDAVETELSLIDRQVQRIDAIVGKLLQFARPTEFGTFEENVDLAEIVQDCLILVDHVVSKKGVRVETRLEETPFVHVNPGELQQVVVNLIINAAQAMDRDGTLSVTLQPDARNGMEGVCLTVADTGPGIDPEHINKVFDPFYTTKLGEGTGLGLSISQTLIQRANGRITARNRPEGGAEFSIWLPKGDEAQHMHAV